MPKYQVTMTCTVMDPEERQRRLARVYRLLLDHVVGQKQTADVSEAGKPDTSAVADAPARRPQAR